MRNQFIGDNAFAAWKARLAISVIGLNATRLVDGSEAFIAAFPIDQDTGKTTDAPQNLGLIPPHCQEGGVLFAPVRRETCAAGAMHLPVLLRLQLFRKIFFSLD